MSRLVFELTYLQSKPGLPLFCRPNDQKGKPIFTGLAINSHMDKGVKMFVNAGLQKDWIIKEKLNMRSENSGQTIYAMIFNDLMMLMITLLFSIE